MTSAVLTFVNLVLFYQSISACEDSKTVVNVDIYYETLCPDSIDFINNQLIPNYDALKNNLIIHFIPYGKASYEKGENGQRYHFICQHGPNECAGNRAQTCAISVINEDTSVSAADRQKQTVKFVGCFMSKDYRQALKDKIEMCVKETGLDENKRNEIMTCSDSVAGDELLAENGDKTSSLNPKLTFVPTVVINHNYSKENQSAALRDFRQLICSFLSNDCNAFNIC